MAPTEQKYRFRLCNTACKSATLPVSLLIVAGGAGGKGTWGKLGDEMELPWVDPNDPNYDSDTQVRERTRELY